MARLQAETTLAVLGDVRRYAERIRRPLQRDARGTH